MSDESPDVQALRREVAAIDWWHRIDLGDGIVTPGRDDSPAKLARLLLPDDLSGKSVLDIGSWDGFFAFEAERRGASRVVALDYWAWVSGSRAGFELARRALGSRVEDVQLLVDEISPDTVGQFDLVLFLGVLYHVPDPLTALHRVASVTTGQLVVETWVDMVSTRRPAAAFYPDGLYGDPTNMWGPNVPACVGLLRAAGFRRVEVVEQPPRAPARLWRALHYRTVGHWRRGRAVIHAWK